MRYLVLSDVHLNQARRLEDTVNALRQIYDIIKNNSVEKVISLGDVYTNRRPTSQERLIFEKWVVSVSRIDSVKEIVLLIGNHDCFPDGLNSYHSFVTLEVDKVRVLSSHEIYDGFFLGHLLLKEAKLGPIDYQIDGGMSAKTLIEKYPDCKAYLLGDVHKAQTIQKDPLVIYAGSINRTDFGERNDDKSVLLIDDGTEFTCKRLILKSRPMVQLDIFPPEIVALRDGEEIAIEDVNDAIVKVIIHGTSEEVKLVDEAELRSIYESRTKEFTIHYNITKETVARDKRVNEDITPAKALELYLERLDLSNEEKQGIITLSQEIIDADS